MKRLCKRFLVWLLLAALLLGTLPGVVFAEEETMPYIVFSEEEPLPEQTDDNTFGKNYLAPVGDYSVRAELLPERQKRGTPPASYNSAAGGYVTSIREQAPYSTCWSHSAIAACETNMIKRGIPVGRNGAAATTKLNLSESQLTWFTYTDAYDEIAMLTGDKNDCVSQTCSYLDVGGNGKLATYTLMRWEGLASEDTAALAYTNASSNGLPSAYAYQYNAAHVQDCIWISASDRDAVKAAIVEYGAGTIGFYYNDAYDSNGAYYYNGETIPNHDAAIVGWDDGYSRYNFKGAATPSRDGAWIIKNSWGEAYGSNGYLYLSYEDVTANKDTCYFYAVESVDNYTKNYQYDGTGNAVSYCSIADGESVANVFIAEGTEQLAAVAFCNEDAGIDYTLQIYTGVSNDPTDGRLAATQTGTFPYAGYHTVKLNTPVLLGAGEKFSVVFTLDNRYRNTTKLPVDETGYHCIPGWVSWDHPIREGTSFWLGNGNGKWLDVSETANLRIKAYTKCEHNRTIAAVFTEPTCTEAGYGHFVCSKCGGDLGDGPIDALGHTFGPWEPIAGSPDAEQSTCTRCQFTQRRGQYQACYYQDFCDCDQTWYHEAVDFAVAEGLMKGVGGGRFEPNATMNRAMVVTVLYRMNGSPKVSEASTFSDVPTGQWYSDAIAWAQDGGIVGGVGNNRFAPEEKITREQIATILWRSEGMPTGTGALDAFRDANQISGFAYNAMRWAVGTGIFNGDGGKLKPNNSATRAEFACIMLRYLGGNYHCVNME